MDDYDFRKIGREMKRRVAEKRLKAAESSNACKLPETELVPIGLYDGSELLLSCYILDDSYTVYMEIFNPELSEVMKVKVKARCKLCDKEIEVWIENNKGKYGWYCGNCFLEIGFTSTEKVDSKPW